MSRKKNYDIGYKAENRIREFLKEHGCTDVRKGVHNGYPDAYFKINNVSFAAECKTVLSFHNGGERGAAKLSRTEFLGMSAMPAEGHIPCMIVELRFGSYRKNVLFFIAWPDVAKKFNSSDAEISDLSFYWVLENARPLKQWIRSRRNA
ncbi:MAG: hypothetical protein ACW968_07565 [Candidatus Thorarchaeota archaeon]